MTYRLSLAVGIAVALLGMRPLPAIAQQLPPMPIQFNPDRLTNPGRPGGRQRGDDSLGICQGELPLTAIAYASSRTIEEPGILQTVESVGMLTTQAQPTLWFYLPEPLTDSATTEFVIKDGNDRVLYSGQLIGETDDSGIVSVPMAVDLALGAAYRWFLTVDCDDNERAVVNGWIERRAPDSTLSNLLAQASSRNRAALYANAGILQDALTELATLRLADLEDEMIARDWIGFLSALDLPELTVAPLLDCCQVGVVQPPVPAIEVDEAVETNVELDEREPVSSPSEPSVIERARDRELPRDR